MSREKQIEEMACDMCGNDEICGGVGVEKCIIYPDYRRKATRLYNAGYRKQIEAEWILNRGGGYLCGNCKKYSTGLVPFCKFCGAKMKGESK